MDFDPTLEAFGLRSSSRQSLVNWARYALRPAGQEPAAHHLAIIRALDAVSSGEVRRLIILLPPGSAKSTYASRLFPAWWFSHHPRSAVIAACHTARLSEHFGRSVRGLLVEHSRYLGVKMRDDARAAGSFVTEGGGEYFGVGVSGAVTGRRADLALIDDPVRSLAEAESFSAREQLWDWFRSELVTRLKPHGRIVLVMTRWHVDDLAGRLLAQGGWRSLRLPALAEAEDPLGRLPGEALWPAWENREALLEKQGMLGERQFSALFQQMPLTETGYLFDPRLLAVVDIVPVGTAVRAWDLASVSDVNGGDPDWTVGLKLVATREQSYFVDDVIRVRRDPAGVQDAIVAAAGRDGVAVPVGLPQDPGQAGRFQVMCLTKALAGYRVLSSPESGAKALRARPVAIQMAKGRLSMRRANWNAAFLDEISQFPNGAKDDQIDALSRAFAMLMEAEAPARFARVPHFER
jgi:predicted phage terminase large subunit-like protein